MSIDETILIMLFVDSIERNDRECLVHGWLFDPIKELSFCKYEEGRKRIELKGYGLPSPDLVDAHGEEAANCRFEIAVPKPNPEGFVVFGFQCGAREIIPLSKNTKIVESIEVQTHQIMNGRYYGKYVLPEGMEVREAVISLGTPWNKTAVSIKKKKGLRFNSDLRTLFLDAPINPEWLPDAINVHLILKDKSIATLMAVGIKARKNDPVFRIQDEFFEWMESKEDALSIVEIGSRARSGVVRLDRISSRHNYTGMDIVAGENVDIVGDAHSLSQLIKPNSVDAIFGFSVFEHLAMPWKVAIELNKILRTGGRAMFLTHHAWPLHDAPFDFWRFSKESWHALFNPSTGFKILDAEVGDAAQLFAELQSNDNFFPCDSYGYLASSVLVEKTKDTQLSWDVPPEEVYQGVYPK